jgi:anti-sigma factor RsiW
MSPHDELDQLSAYIDGELEPHDRARVEAHLSTCAECSATIDALRATLADLSALPEPVPTPQDSWALRSAIARARRPARRWQRVAVAAGSLAAAVVAFAVFASSGGGGGALTASKDAAGPQRQAAGASVPVYTYAQDFSLQTAHAHLLEVSGKVPAGAALGVSTDAARSESRSGPVPLNAPAAEFAAETSAFTPQIDRCVNVVKRSTQVLLTPVRYEVVTFESKAAFFLIFSTPDRFELWVVTRNRCEVLYFAQTA